MRKLLLTLSIATAVTFGAAPMSAHAENLTIPSDICSKSLVQSSLVAQRIIIIKDEEGIKQMKNLLEKCVIRFDVLLQNGCSNRPNVDTTVPDTSMPEYPTPEETQPAPPVLENTKPETIVPETQAPEIQTPETQTPETQAPEIQTPEIQIPETQVPETQIPETQIPETSVSKPQPPAALPEDAENSSESETVHPYVLRIVNLVNEERAKAGLNPVTLDTAASNAALVRSKEIVSSFSHTRPNGSSFTTALKEQGISYRLAGENIAWGQKTPEQVMEAWMNSSGHRANILKESFTHIGVGYYQKNGINYWTQLFFSVR